MKNLNFLKASSLLMVVLVMATFLFTSTNTTDKSNDQIIAELSKEVAVLKENAKEDKEAFGNIEYAYVGEIQMFAGSFAPRDWAFCNGQLLPVSGNEALFSLIGCQYGGDCRSNFALPDLRGRVPVHSGDSQGPGLNLVKWGEKGGIEELQTSKIQVSTSGDNKTEVVSRIINVNNRQPYLGINYIIALNGQFPSRN